MSHVMRSQQCGFNRSDTNRAVQAQKMARGWKFLDLENIGIVLSVQPNKGADLRLCFSIM